MNENTKTKYPRTFHLPWSLGRSNDDKVLKNIDHLNEREVIVTEKFDGENTTLYRDAGFHARSLDGRRHPSRDWLAAFHATICKDIPEGWRICGENMYAKHSVAYDALPSYFLGFSIWNEKNVCLGWDESVEWFELLGIEPVKVLWRGLFDEDQIRYISNRMDLTTQEGYVVRSAGSFPYDQFGMNVAKFVREHHVQTTEHWMHSEIVPNGLVQNHPLDVNASIFR